MKKLLPTIFILILAGVVGYLAGSAAAPKGLSAAQEESVYDRVMDSGTIRCGYVNRHPVMLKNPKTGKFEGIFYEYIQALGDSLNLKIEMFEEVGWGDMIQALKNDRIDAFCAGLWPVMNRAPHIDFVSPVLYEKVVAVVRADDTRFDYNSEAINDPNITITSAEGSAPLSYSRQRFPKVDYLLIPQLTPLSDIYENVRYKKADLAVAGSIDSAVYIENNPGILRFAKSKQGGLRGFALSLGIKADEYRYKRMLDLATQELQQNGTLDRILDKYEEKYPDAFYRVAPPYRAQ